MPLLYEDHWLLGLVCRGADNQLQTATWDPLDGEWEAPAIAENHLAGCTLKHALKAMHLPSDTVCGAMPAAALPNSPPDYKQADGNLVDCGILVFMQALLQMSAAAGTHQHLEYNGDRSAARGFLAAGIVEGRLPLPRP